MPPRQRDDHPELPLFETPNTSSLSRKFLGWEKPVLTATVDYLSADWNGEGALDLSPLLIVVPTRNAGRRLREALAIRAARKEAAVFPPLVVTPDYLVSPERLTGGGAKVATLRATELIWTGLLLDLSLDQYRRVFPVDPVRRDLKWASDNARELLSVRQLLTESVLTFDQAAEQLARHDMEPGRWEELSRLEAYAVNRTQKLGWDDESQAKLKAAKEGALPPEVKKIVAAGLSDIKPLVGKALEHYGDTLEVDLLVYAPGEEKSVFDTVGRPLPQPWLNREIFISAPEETIHQAATPLGQAEKARGILTEYENPAGIVAVGIPDPEVAPALEQTLANHSLGSYDPAGRPVSREGLCYLLRLTHEAVSEGAYHPFLQLLRCPGFSEAALRTLPGESKSPTALRRDLDSLAVDSLPFSLRDALASAKRRTPPRLHVIHAIEWTLSWIDRFRKEKFTAVLADYLSEIFADTKFSPHDPKRDVFTQVAECIHALPEELRIAEAAAPYPLDLNSRFELLHSALRDRRTYPEREPGDIDLQGWLELVWEDAPHLIVTGLNDHVVPESIVSHAFLPDSARRVLGIPNNDDRFARDAYLLTVMLEGRRQKSARVDLIFGRQSSSGDPLRPSRLLFQCQDEELPQRTLHLFKENELDRSPVARSVAWKLFPREIDDDNRIFQKLSVTSFKQYLTCPFRFYLKQGLRMESVEIDKREMDSLDFGNLIHDTLERFANDATLRQSRDASEIASYFLEELDRYLNERFGNRLTTPVVIQRESARQRLKWWARQEAEQRLQGWEIFASEIDLSDEEFAFEILGMPVRGRIDRVERHPDLGFRVFDFKTFSPMEYNRIKTVDRYHLTSLKRSEDPDMFPDWALCQDEKGKWLRWVDLQVPLYRIALGERFPDTPVSAGYVTLGKTESEVRIDVWESLNEERLASARACAEGVIESIRNRNFWPPNEQMPAWDEFREILSPTAEETVNHSLFP